MIELISRILNILTLLTDGVIVVWIALWIASWLIRPLTRIRAAILSTVGPYTRIVAFIVALVSMCGSLFFSEVAHYTPCLLCWYQRIAMYPQVLILGISIVSRDRRGVVYAMALSIVGTVLASYHYFIQLGGPSILPCSAVGYSVECSQRFTTEYGYITIAMMALTAFVSIIILSGIFLGYQKKQ